jgi:hypothetical protein
MRRGFVVEFARDDGGVQSLLSLPPEEEGRRLDRREGASRWISD